MRIDAHHHVWDLAVRDQSWTRDLPALRRSFGMDELGRELVDHSIDGTLLVQTITVPEETPELLALALRDPRILGVVGWVDLTGATVATDLARLKGMPGGDLLVGVRHQVQSEIDPNWLLRDDVINGLQAVADAGLVYELLVTHEQLEAAEKAVALVEGGRWVLDHAGKPPIAGGVMDPWRVDVQRLARHANVACKLSGLVTEARPQWTVSDIRPFADHVLRTFGSDRVLAGSDWPVCLLAASYREVNDLHADLLGRLPAAEQTAILGGNAAQWYGLHARTSA